MRRFDSSVLLGTAALELRLRQRTTSDVTLRFAHQPNIFASGYVLSTAAIADSIARLTIKPGAAVTLNYVVIDYDAADDERTFRAPIPRTMPTPGVNYRRVITRRHAKDRLACSVESSEIIKNLAVLYRCILEGSLGLRHALATTGFPVASRGRCRSIVRHSFDILETLLLSQPRLTDVTALHNAWVLQEVFYCSRVQIITGSQWLASYSEQRLSLTRELLRANPAWGERLIWATCQQCFRRMRTTASIAGEDVTVEHHQCDSCGTRSKEALLRLDHTIESPAGPCPKYVPSVHLDDILDRYVGDHDISVYYPGSYAHAQEAVRILGQAERKGLKTPRLPTPDWCPTMSELAWIWDAKVSDPKFCGLLGRISACTTYSLTPDDFAGLFEDRVHALRQRRMESTQG